MMNQLLLSKRIFLEACSYADRSDPVSAGIAISMFQDAVEIYIWSLIKDRDINIAQNAGFEIYIKEIRKAGINIPQIAKILEPPEAPFEGIG